MTPDIATTSAPARIFTLDQADALYDHVHRVLLYGTLVRNGLEHEGAAKDQILEGFQALVDEMITHAEAAEMVLAQARRVFEKGGA